jgi:hypothetical protein
VRVIAVSNVDLRPKDIVITDLDEPTRINHKVAVEVVPASNPNTNAIIVCIQRPEPTSLSKGIVTSDVNLTESTAATAPFHPVPYTLFHAEKAVH